MTEEERAQHKEFLLFYGAIFYPSGGWKDYISSFDSEEEAIRFAVSLKPDYHWFQVIQNGKIIVDAEGGDEVGEMKVPMSWHMTPSPIR